MEEHKASEEIDVLLRKAKKVKLISGAEITIRPLVMQDYLTILSQVLIVVDKIVEKNADVDIDSFKKGTFKPTDLTKVLAEFPEFIGFVEAALHLGHGFLLKNADLADMVVVVNTLLEVNRYEAIVKNLQAASEIVKRARTTEKKLDSSQ